MLNENSLEFKYLEWSILVFLLVAGLFGNLIGLLVLMQKKGSNLPSRSIYIALGFIDSFALVYEIVHELLQHNCYDIFNFSYVLCKFLKYIDYSIPSVSGWLLVSISIDRFISIQFSKFYITKKYWLQKILILTAFFFNIIIYTPIIIFADFRANLTVKDLNSSIEEPVYICGFYEREIIVVAIDLICGTSVPFLFMLTFSGLLIIIIFKSRLKVLNLSNQHDRNRLKKDIKFAVSSIFYNLFFFILNIFNCINRDHSKIEYDISNWVYCVSFCVNFYILFASNSIFRREIFTFFHLKFQYSV